MLFAKNSPFREIKIFLGGDRGMKKIKRFCRYIFIAGIVVLLLQIIADICFWEASSRNYIFIGIIIGINTLVPLIINLIGPKGKKRRRVKKLNFLNLLTKKERVWRKSYE